MTNLIDIITKNIENEGQMNLTKFMHLALTNKEHGYYSNIQHIGQKGDFITSPEISQLFGEIIGIWCANLWQIIGCPNDIMIVELGPGNGTLANDIIRATKNILGFHQAISLHFIELDSKLNSKQQSTLNHIKHIKKYWHTHVDQLPKKTAIFIANEFFDALPITQYIKRKNQWYGIGIDINQSNKELHFCEMPIDAKIQNILAQEYSHAPQDGIIEFCKKGEDIVEQIAIHINKYNGGGLFIDYGYADTTDRLFTSSLQAVKNHKYCTIFNDLGKADISTHVNFSALTKTARIQDIKTYGPITQHEFLLNMHINARKDTLLKNATATQKELILNGYHRLINQNQMGSLFKTIALTRPEINQYIGFKA